MPAAKSRRRRSRWRIGKRILAVVVFFLFASLFWGAYEQAGSTLNLFADRYVHLEAFGIKLYAVVFVSSRRRSSSSCRQSSRGCGLRLGSRQPSSPAKFALALLFMGVAFLILMPAGAIAQGGVKVSPLWLVGVYSSKSWAKYASTRSGCRW